MASNFVVLGFACVFAAALLVTYRLLHAQDHLPGSSQQDINPANLIHVCLCSDNTDLRPTAVAIRSVYANARDPQLLKFHFVTSPELAHIANELLATHLPEVYLEVHSNAKLLQRISKELSYRPTSKVSREMSSVFSFAPFFLPEFLSSRTFGTVAGISRLIYLDTDTVMLGDVRALQALDLKGKAVAAVRSCEQRLGHLVDFELLKKSTSFVGHARSTDCLISRAMFVMDVSRYRTDNIGNKVLQWLQQYKEQDLMEDLWTGSMSIPPWMLALDRGVVDIGPEWDCLNLGAEELTVEESKALRQYGLRKEDLGFLGQEMGISGQLIPGLHRCSGTARLLHFGGPIKPWLDTTLDHAEPVCALPQVSPPTARGWSREGEPTSQTLKCKDLHLTRCSNLWWAFLSDDLDCGLKDFEKAIRDEDAALAR